MTIPRRRGTASAFAVPLLAAALLLAGCAAEPEPDPEPSTPAAQPSATPDPTPTPDPTAPPRLGDLVLSADGLGTLELGSTAQAGTPTAMLTYDAEACTDERTGLGLGIGPGDPLAGLWQPIPEYGASGGGHVFGVGVEPGSRSIERIDVLGPEIPTDAGVRVGDPAQSAIEAYPSASVVSGGLVEIVVVSGPRGSLQIEIARNHPGDPVYWEADQVDTVVFLHATTTQEPFSIAATDNVVGVCPF